jgi:hypothetical protein
MIRYALKCAEDHRFESWFQSASAFDTLCGAAMWRARSAADGRGKGDHGAPRRDGGKGPACPPQETAVPKRPLSGPAHPAEQMLRKLRDHIEKNSTYVGNRFAAEARAMHAGDKDESAIHGRRRRRRRARWSRMACRSCRCRFRPGQSN